MGQGALEQRVGQHSQTLHPPPTSHAHLQLQPLHAALEFGVCGTGAVGLQQQVGAQAGGE